MGQMNARSAGNERTKQGLAVGYSLCMLAACLSLLTVGILKASDKRPVLTDREKSIVDELKGLRDVPDDKRGEATKRIALEIRNLPADGAKVGLANSLANLSTEGDFGHDTLQEVATTLADSLKEQPSQGPQPYLELAQLIHY
jgi:hypothetical protein